jgi:hypothetical protein
VVFSWTRSIVIGLALGIVLGIVLHNYWLGLFIGVLSGAGMRLVQQRRARGEQN